jgi:hypothetical protein
VGQLVVVVGDLEGGFRFVGPFQVRTGKESASAWAKKATQNEWAKRETRIRWSIIELETPAICDCGADEETGEVDEGSNLNCPLHGEDSDEDG